MSGSRNWNRPDLVHRALDEQLAIARHDGEQLVVKHGNCPTGADAQAARWTSQSGLSHRVTEEVFYAQWDTHGRKAGPVRNAEMVASGADVALIFCRRESPGTVNTRDLAIARGIPVLEWTLAS